MEPTVSVIVPVYNVAQYLPRCLDSLARQTLKGIEIIAVDDGSTDGSGKILDDYAVHEPRLKVIHQANAGAGAARNAGLEVAKGDYLFFCDPDDVCAPEMLERLVARADADGSDVVIAQYFVREANRRRKVNDARMDAWPRKRAVHPDEIADVIFDLTGHTVWDKLFRRAHIESNGLRFQLLPRFNDMLFCDTALVTARRISFERKPYYEHLVSRADGLQSGKCRDTTTIFAVYDELGAFLRARGLFETYRTSFIAAYVRSGISILRKMLENADRFGAVWNRLRSELRRICAGNVPARLALSEAQKDFLRCLLSKSSTVEDGCRLARDGGLLRSTAREFAGALLIFPVLTTVFVAAGFLVGIPCSAWHLWAGVAGTMGIIWWWERNGRALAVATALLLALLGALWVLAGVLCPEVHNDDMTYHLPALRMLSEGWNPIWQGKFKMMREAFDLVRGTFRARHILTMPKGVWYFCASFYRLTGAHFNVWFSIVPILLLSLSLTVIKAVRPLGRMRTVMALAALLVFACLLPKLTVDAVIGLSAAGLLTTMVRIVKDNQWDWIPLFAYSFWMCVAKQTSLLHCAVFWVAWLIALALVRRRIVLRRMGAFFVLGSVAVGLVSVSPYATSYVRFGSPLYPRYSSDPVKYPTANPTADFLERNRDAAEMGHLGAWCNAFVSHDVVRRYYVWKTGRPDFCPRVRTWWGKVGSPTKRGYRIAFCLSLVVLLVCCGAAGRFLAVSAIFGTLAVPTEMIGYLRYVPWVPWTVVGCAVLLPSSRGMTGLVTIFSLWWMSVRVPTQVVRFAREIDGQRSVVLALNEDPPHALLCPPVRPKPAANIELLRRAVPELAHSRVVADCRAVTQDPAGCRPFYDQSFFVTPEYDLARFSDWQRLQSDPQSRRGHWKLRFVIRTLFVTLPKNILERMRDL